MLLELDMGAGVSHEQDGDREAGNRHCRCPRHQHVTRGEVRRQPAADARGECDAAVPGRLVEPERKPATLWANQVDLHHDGHGPREPLVDAEQHIRGHDDFPTGCDSDEQRDGQRE